MFRAGASGNDFDFSKKPESERKKNRTSECRISERDSETLWLSIQYTQLRLDVPGAVGQVSSLFLYVCELNLLSEGRNSHFYRIAARRHKAYFLHARYECITHWAYRVFQEGTWRQSIKLSVTFTLISPAASCMRSLLVRH